MKASSDWPKSPRVGSVKPHKSGSAKCPVRAYQGGSNLEVKISSRLICDDGRMPDNTEFTPRDRSDGAVRPSVVGKTTRERSLRIAVARPRGVSLLNPR